MIAVLVAESNRVMKIGISSALHETAGFSIVGEAADACQLVALAATAGADVVLVELGLLNELGMAGLAAFRTAQPHVGLLAYSHTRNMPCGIDLQRAGVSGYLTRGCSPTELRIAISTVAAGRPYINASFARLLAQDVFRPDHLADTALSDKEMRVFKMLAIGIDARGIAAQLGLSAQAVGAVKSRIMDKMDGAELTDLTRFALAHGFI